MTFAPALLSPCTQRVSACNGKISPDTMITVPESISCSTYAIIFSRVYTAPSLLRDSNLPSSTLLSELRQLGCINFLWVQMS
jgi:hypothetical protein